MGVSLTVDFIGVSGAMPIRAVSLRGPAGAIGVAPSVPPNDVAGGGEGGMEEMSGGAVVEGISSGTVEAGGGRTGASERAMGGVGGRLAGEPLGGGTGLGATAGGG